MTVNDVPAKYNAGFNAIPFSKCTFNVLNTSDKQDESWLILGINMPEGFKINKTPVPLVTMPIAVSSAKLAEGESMFKPAGERLEVVSDGLLLSMDKNRNMRLEKA